MDEGAKQKSIIANSIFIWMRKLFEALKNQII